MTRIRADLHFGNSGQAHHIGPRRTDASRKMGLVINAVFFFLSRAGSPFSDPSDFSDRAGQLSSWPTRNVQVNKSGNGGSAPPVDLPIHLLLLLHSSSQLDVICISEENSRSPGFCRQQVADFNPTRSRVSQVLWGEDFSSSKCTRMDRFERDFSFYSSGCWPLGTRWWPHQRLSANDWTPRHDREIAEREEMVIMMKRESDLLLLLAGGGYSSFAHFTYLRSVHRCGLSFFTMSLI